jgi:hypothetical protein
LASGNVADAERVLSTHLNRIHAEARGSGQLPESVGDAAAGWAVRLARATGKPVWIGYVFALFTIARRPLPAPIVDELYSVIQKVPPIDLGLLREYVGVIRERPDLGPAARFLVQRISGLEAVAASR